MWRYRVEGASGVPNPHTNPFSPNFDHLFHFAENFFYLWTVF